MKFYSSKGEKRLEKRLNHAEAKVTKLTTQLDANRRATNKLTNEKIELQSRDKKLLNRYFSIWVFI